jgi:hypothetical protein
MLLGRPRPDVEGSLVPTAAGSDVVVDVSWTKSSAVFLAAPGAVLATVIMASIGSVLGAIAGLAAGAVVAAASGVVATVYVTNEAVRVSRGIFVDNHDPRRRS